MVSPAAGSGADLDALVVAGKAILATSRSQTTLAFSFGQLPQQPTRKPRLGSGKGSKQLIGNVTPQPQRPWRAGLLRLLRPGRHPAGDAGPGGSRWRVEEAFEQPGEVGLDHTRSASIWPGTGISPWPWRRRRSWPSSAPSTSNNAQNCNCRTTWAPTRDPEPDRRPRDHRRERLHEPLNATLGETGESNLPTSSR